MEETWGAESRARLRDRTVDLDVLLGDAVDTITAELGADRGTLYLLDHASRTLVSHVGHLPEIAEIRLRLGEGVAGQVARTGKPMRIRAAETDARVARRFDEQTGYHTRSLMAAPLCGDDGSVIAVLEVLNKLEGDFDREDESHLLDCAGHLAGLMLGTSLRSQLGPGTTQPLAYRFNNIIGTSAPMQQAYDLIERSARTDVTVLIRGESGTGKELFARALHDNSPRANGPFVVVDCAALPDTLIENELFGHEKGAYTGADQATEGQIAAAQGGTLLLDEIGELPLPVQGKLLRLLQEKSYLRVGGRDPRTADVRFVCATHRDLERGVEEGGFRQDLYYRLRVVEIEIPPLRRRGHGDIDRLVDHFVTLYGQRYGRPGMTLSPLARNALHGHDWPGNVRELEHCIESAVVLAPESTLEASQLRLPAVGPIPSPGEVSLPEDAFVTGVRPLREVERAYVQHVLRLHGDNRSATARALAIGRNTLLRKLNSERDPS